MVWLKTTSKLVFDIYYTVFSLQKRASPLSVSFIHHLCPGLPSSFRFYLSITPFSFFIFSFHPALSAAQLSPPHSFPFPVECLCVCHYAHCDTLCTQRFVRSSSQSLHAATSSIIKCNRTFSSTAEQCEALCVV